LVNILVGTEPPTSGVAFVGGFDVVAQPMQANMHVGLCPQHDVLWFGQLHSFRILFFANLLCFREDLTVEEHLLFYNRLKGVPRSEEAECVVRNLSYSSVDKNIQ